MTFQARYRYDIMGRPKPTCAAIFVFLRPESTDVVRHQMKPAELFDLTGKVAVITGSTKGIGKEIAVTMAGAGARVVISSRKPEPCDDVARAVTDAGGTALAVPCNVSDLDHLRRLVDATLDA